MDVMYFVRRSVVCRMDWDDAIIRKFGYYVPSKDLIIENESSGGYRYYSITRDRYFLNEVKTVYDGDFREYRKLEKREITYPVEKIFEVDDKKMMKLIDDLTINTQTKERIDTSMNDLEAVVKEN